MEQALLRALVGCIEFIANSPDDVVHPDAAVRALEDVGHTLRTLPEKEQVALAQRILAFEVDAEGSRAAFIRSLPDAIGLAAD